MKIVAISGLDDPTPPPAAVYAAWACVIGLTGFILWGTLRAPRRASQ